LKKERRAFNYAREETARRWMTAVALGRGENLEDPTGTRRRSAERGGGAVSPGLFWPGNRKGGVGVNRRVTGTIDK